VNHRGHPIRGAISGLVFGLFLSLDLLIFGVVALDAAVLAVLPLLGLLAGLALGLKAPLHRRRAVDDNPAEPTPLTALSPTSERDPSVV